ncbi:MAG TPA: acyltransferase [Chthoniobacterales bacterium]
MDLRSREGDGLTLPSSPDRSMGKPREGLRSHTALRGIAAMTVLLGHLPITGLFPRSSTTFYLCQFFSWNVEAVFLFFILSGFILNFVYGGAPIRWRAFFVARFARVYPVYILTLLLALGNIFLSAAIREVPLPVSAGQVLANVLMTQSWPLVYQDSINIPGWSLSVEAFLYLLVFPGLILLRRRHTGLIALLTVPCAAVALWLQHDNGPLLDRLPGAYILEGCSGFLIGFALCQCVPNGVRSRFVDVASMLAVAAAILAFFDVLPKMALALILPSIVAFTIDQGTFLSQALSGRWLVFLGEISYSVYIWHWPIVLGLTHVWGVRSLGASELDPAASLTSKVGYLASSVLLSLVVGALSYFFFEIPVRKRIRTAFQAW